MRKSIKIIPFFYTFLIFFVQFHGEIQLLPEGILPLFLMKPDGQNLSDSITMFLNGAQIQTIRG